MIVVSNSGPLIHLSKVGYFSLLQSLFGSIRIPPGVYHEVVVAGRGLPGCEETEAACSEGWITQEPPQDTLAVAALRNSLGLGEAETLVRASECHADFVLLDDGKARTFATRLGLCPMGTLGILRAGQKRNLVADLKKCVDELIRQGFRLSPSLYQKVTGASWPG